jgi:two-component system, NtrC family, nitrogen regulation sensor histidine kinase NtrY
VNAVRRAATTALVVLPSLLVAMWLIGDPVFRQRGFVVLGAVLASTAILVTLDRRRERRLGTIAAILAAYREGDFSIRARKGSDAGLYDVVTELNDLGETLRTHRLGEMEAWALLRKVMAEVDVVVFAVDDQGRIRVANDAASKLLDRAAPEILGQSAASLGLADLLEGAAPRTIQRDGGPWELRRGNFRLEGTEHRLIVLSDVSRALRDSERDAWRKLIVVMGHEINNSLSPIQSIADSLASIADPKRRMADWETDLREGLAVIARRADALGRFMASYAALAKLPPPKLAPVAIATLARKVAALETRTRVEVATGPDASVVGDADQLEQALINLVKNAAEASLPSGGAVRIDWSVERDHVTLSIEDDGHGVSDTANLFVPFFTTKPHGSGIGLTLCRQIVEAHDGRISLTSRVGVPGAVARIRLRRAS